MLLPAEAGAVRRTAKRKASVEGTVSPPPSVLPFVVESLPPRACAAENVVDADVVAVAVKIVVVVAVVANDDDAPRSPPTIQGINFWTSSSTID